MSELTDEVKREIGQHFVFGFHGHELSKDIITLIRDYHLGNVILMKRNVKDIPQVHRLTRALQRLAKESGHAQPLLIGIDQENGLVSAFSSPTAGTQFPGAMALAATGSIDLAEEVTFASATEMKLAGINWAYSPVADVNSDPRNPVIGVRSFGDNAHEVGQYVKAVAKGLRAAGVAPCPKHFAGHGDTHVDSHLAQATILKTKEQLSEVELVPFRTLIEGGVETIMTGHMALPLVTGDDTPCSLSKTLTTDLLRNELGFQGVIVTDCLEMEAVAEKYGSEGGAVQSLQAGADIAMVCHRMDRHRGSIEATYDAVRTGKLSLDNLQSSGQRIKALKDQFAGTWDDVLSSELDVKKLAVLKEKNAALSERAYAASTALIRDPHNTLPLHATGPIVLFTPQIERLNPAVDDAESLLRDKAGKPRNTAGPSYIAFEESVARRGAPITHVVYSPSGKLPDQADRILRDGASAIFCTRNADRSIWQIDYLRSVLDIAPPAHVVLVATCAPYDLMNARDVDVAFLATLEFTPPALEAAAAVIFGERKAAGRVPVLGGTVL